MKRISLCDIFAPSTPFELPSYERRLVGNYPELLRAVINDNLTKKQKCYIIMYYKDNMSITEIAEQFNVNKSTVSRTINRGRQRLAKALKCEILKRCIKKED